VVVYTGIIIAIGVIDDKDGYIIGVITFIGIGGVFVGLECVF